MGCGWFNSQFYTISSISWQSVLLFVFIPQDRIFFHTKQKLYFFSDLKKKKKNIFVQILLKKICWKLQGQNIYFLHLSSKRYISLAEEKRYPPPFKWSFPFCNHSRIWTELKKYIYKSTWILSSLLIWERNTDLLWIKTQNS